MKNLSLFRIAWRNVTLNWRHSLAALISISAGFVSLSMFEGYMSDVKWMYEVNFFRRAMYGHLLIEKTGAQSHGYEESYLYELGPAEQAIVDEYVASRGQDVVNRVRFLNVSGLITNGGTSSIFAGFGVDVKEGARMRGPGWEWNTLSGLPLNRAKSPDSLNVGQSLGAILDCASLEKNPDLDPEGGYPPTERPFKCKRDRLQLNVTTHAGQLNSIDAPVAGLVDAVYKDVDTKFVSMPLETAQKLLDTPNVSFYSVELSDDALVPGFISGLKSFAEAKGAKIEAARWEDHPYGDMYVRTMDLLTVFRNFVVAVILAIAGLSTLNTLLKIVKERTREIGMLRSLGYGRDQVILMFGAEAVFLGMLGNFLGLLASAFFTAILNRLHILYKAGVLTEPVPFRIAYDSSIYLTSTLFLTAIALIAAIVPAYQATRERISDNLSHV